MSEINPKIFDALYKKLKSFQTGVQTNTGKALAKCCALVQREVQESMRDTELDYSKTYYTHNKKKGHHPSQVRKPPAVDTGTLRRSITYEVNEVQLVGKVGSTLQNPPYGVFLEFGTTRMPTPRPFLKPALEKCKPQIKEILTEEMNRAKE